ncbi:hypothetical protein V5799_027530 [Amblyomma americanum]|uniref:Uncharacterized protein n=1 Tax=Amblyomma americanum TaxID=6943 RepID=A0AAQ4DFG5_AMBAM
MSKEVTVHIHRGPDGGIKVTLSEHRSLGPVQGQSKVSIRYLIDPSVPALRLKTTITGGAAPKARTATTHASPSSESTLPTTTTPSSTSGAARASTSGSHNQSSESDYLNIKKNQ